MLIALWPIVFAALGVLLYVLPTNAKVQECGRILFFCGVFFTVAALAEHVLRLGVS